MDQKGLRGSSAALIDPKGRLKVPATFRGVIQDLHGADVFVTSLTGESVRIYPMPVWREIERKLSNMASTHPSRSCQSRINRPGYLVGTDRSP